MSALSDHLTLVTDSVQAVTGWTEVISLSSLTVGAQDITYKVPGNTWALVKTATCSFTTDATAGNRVPHIDFLDTYGNVLYAAPVAAAIAASTTVQICAAVGVGYSLVSGAFASLSFPALLLQSGYSVRFRHDAVGVADALSAPFLYVERYPTDAIRASLSATGE